MNRSSPLPLPTRVLLFEHLAAMEKAGVPAERAYALLDLGAPTAACLTRSKRACCARH